MKGSNVQGSGAGQVNPGVTAGGYQLPMDDDEEVPVFQSNNVVDDEADTVDDDEDAMEDEEADEID